MRPWFILDIMNTKFDTRIQRNEIYNPFLGTWYGHGAPNHVWDCRYSRMIEHLGAFRRSRKNMEDWEHNGNGAYCSVRRTIIQRCEGLSLANH